LVFNRRFLSVFLFLHVASISPTDGGRFISKNLKLLVSDLGLKAVFLILHPMGAELTRPFNLRNYCGNLAAQNIASCNDALNFRVKLSYIYNLFQ